jgi:hypothetical protein
MPPQILEHSKSKTISYKASNKLRAAMSSRAR